MKMNHVEGKDKGHIVLYALSTCVWCRKTKGLLNELGVDYYYVDVDLLDGDEREEAMEEVEKFNPKRSFPTIVIDNEKSISGFQEDEVRRAVG